MPQRIETSLYHSFLRIGVCVFALITLFDSGLLLRSTATMSSTAQDYVASAVGVRVGVAPNEVNVLTARITELEREVAAKDREIAVNLNTEAGKGVDRSTFILSSILFILLVLIVLNYALDYIRTMNPRPVRPRVSVS